MELPDLPFTITDWSQLPATEHAGETGHALWRTQDIDGVRVRMVEYSPGYLADHWCDKGHILLVLKQKGTEVITVSRKSYGLLRQCLIACAVCDEQAWIFLIVG
ncbi:MAG TPA: DHCW motif cupin fold protein [Ancylobacter sp.]